MNTSAYSFTIWIDGNHYTDDKIIKVPIPLSDNEVATLKQLVRDYEGNPDKGLMPILETGSNDLYRRFHDIIYPRVFFELFDIEHVEDDDIRPGDKHRTWDFGRDIEYMMDTYGEWLDCDDAYICYIPTDMRPPHLRLTKDSPLDDIIKYVRLHKDIRDLVPELLSCYGVDELLNLDKEVSAKIVEEKMISWLQEYIAKADNETLSSESFFPLIEFRDCCLEILYPEPNN